MKLKTLKYISIILLFNILVSVNAAEIYMIMDFTTDESKIRSLIMLDDRPMMFINKDKSITLDQVIVEPEIKNYDFTIRAINNSIKKITYSTGTGSIKAINNDSETNFTKAIKTLSYENTGTGTGPWPSNFITIINDVRIIPRNSTEAFAIYNNHVTLLKKTAITDNRK